MMLGIWMWPESLLRESAETVADRLSRHGVTDIFFLTKGLSGKTAFPSRLCPIQAEGRDLLGELIAAAHKRNMRVHAWFTSASDAAYKEKHPESGLFHLYRGRDRGIVSVADGPYMDFMADVIGEMLAGWDVDGVHLDYIRYNHLLYGWSGEDINRLQARGADAEKLLSLTRETFPEGGKEGTAIFDAYRAGDKDVLRLAESRTADVTAFAARLVSAAREAKRDLCVSCALMPEGAYEDLAFADLHYGQHYASLAPMMDLFVPMIYSRAFDKDEKWVAMAAAGAVKYGVKTLAGLHAYDGGTAESLMKDAEAARGVPGVCGTCLFREGAFVWAAFDGHTLTVENTTEMGVTRILTAEEELPVSVLPGETKEISVRSSSASVRFFSGDKEMCGMTDVNASSSEHI